MIAEGRGVVAAAHALDVEGAVARWTRVAQPARILIAFLALSLLGYASSGTAGVSGALALPVIGAPGPTLTTDDLSAPQPAVLSAVPWATTEFLAAYARGDGATADELASPLYRAEWERRGLSAEVRTWLVWPEHRQGEPFAERLRFTFVGGVIDASGFDHLLFASRPVRPDVPSTPSVYRVDVDPQGRVVWLELVWHFGDEVDATRSVHDPVELARVPLPPMPCCVRLLFGVASMDGREGYYAFASGGVGPSGYRVAEQARPATVRFLALDADRQIRPGAWSYDDDAGLAEYGKPRPERSVPRLGAEDSTLWREYLSTLD